MVENRLPGYVRKPRTVATTNKHVTGWVRGISSTLVIISCVAFMVAIVFGYRLNWVAQFVDQVLIINLLITVWRLNSETDRMIEEIEAYQSTNRAHQRNVILLMMRLRTNGYEN